MNKLGPAANKLIRERARAVAQIDPQFWVSARKAFKVLSTTTIHEMHLLALELWQRECAMDGPNRPYWGEEQRVESDIYDRLYPRYPAEFLNLAEWAHPDQYLEASNAVIEGNRAWWEAWWGHE